VPVPAVLLTRIRPRQETAGALRGETQAMKKLAHMSRMVGDAELRFDDRKRVAGIEY
jgi:hypothetical protein